MPAGSSGLGMHSAPSLCRTPASAGSEGCSAQGIPLPSHSSRGPRALPGATLRGQERRAPSDTQRGQEQALCSEQPLETAELDPSGRFPGGVSVTLLAKHGALLAAGKQDGTGVPAGPACSTRGGSGGQRREQQGWMQKRQKKKTKKGHQQPWVGPQGHRGERQCEAPQHVTGDRQTDSPVPIRYVKYHHSGTLTDL